jgi:hypothetical protein
VKRLHARTSSVWTPATIILAFAVACSSSEGREDTTPTTGADGRDTTLRAIVPSPDSIGGLPSQFEWTAVEGVDRYAIVLMNESDSMLWRQENLRTSSVDRPPELDLDAGTYFWRITAQSGNRQIADSGWSAFIVKR